MEDEKSILSLPYSNLKQIPTVKEEVQSIILYHNKITSIRMTYLPNVHSLDLSDNLITTIQDLENLPNLRTLDLGYNLLTQIQNLSFLPLTDLFLMCNDIERIENLGIPSLKNLDLACNNITKIENLTCINLEELYLGNNRIRTVENVEHLSKLHTLSLQCNCIQRIDCLKLPKNLKYLLLDGNEKLQELENLECLRKLEYLDVSKTKVKEHDISEREGLDVVFA
ncbi:Protein phosphatase 1, regulatory subunit [Trachipleistophora hominis]|uniref:Protein phosphatase 1, regulatory subunit n=1 Tax=Trachipleistophora hominis TaxID=72359 RepID=L7JUV8_TRAHO|nr:Protein phosphatase 1, regulatory subunit [Trachipleistophora hominis]